MKRRTEVKIRFSGVGECDVLIVYSSFVKVHGSASDCFFSEEDE